MMVARAAPSSPSGAWPITRKIPLYLLREHPRHHEGLRRRLQPGAGQALGQVRDNALSKRESSCFPPQRAALAVKRELALLYWQIFGALTQECRLLALTSK